MQCVGEFLRVRVCLYVRVSRMHIQGLVYTVTQMQSTPTMQEAIPGLLIHGERWEGDAVGNERDFGERPSLNIHCLAFEC